MDFITDGNKIIARNAFFSVKDTLYCGQMFRFKPYGEGFIVYSKDKACKIEEKEGKVIIETDDLNYFINYFDLNNDYSIIIDILKNDVCLSDILAHNMGIRICNQDPFEMIISFILSQNNNIPRIKLIIDRLCREVGRNMGNYYAFPTILEMSNLDVDFYNKIGCGYRANYLYDTVNKIINDGFDVNRIFEMDKTDAKILLKTLKGVGDKVADCILLFGYHKTDCFPVDTWIEKVYRDSTGDMQSDRKIIERYYTNKYRQYSGYAQQYLFHFKRLSENKG